MCPRPTRAPPHAHLDHPPWLQSPAVLTQAQVYDVWLELCLGRVNPLFPSSPRCLCACRYLSAYLSPSTRLPSLLSRRVPVAVLQAAGLCCLCLCLSCLCFGNCGWRITRLQTRNHYW